MFGCLSKISAIRVAVIEMLHVFFSRSCNKIVPLLAAPVSILLTAKQISNSSTLGFICAVAAFIRGCETPSENRQKNLTVLVSISLPSAPASGYTLR